MEDQLTVQVLGIRNRIQHPGRVKGQTLASLPILSAQSVINVLQRQLEWHYPATGEHIPTIDSEREQAESERERAEREHAARTQEHEACLQEQAARLRAEARV